MGPLRGACVCACVRAWCACVRVCVRARAPSRCVRGLEGREFGTGGPAAAFAEGGGGGDGAGEHGKKRGGGKGQEEACKLLFVKTGVVGGANDLIPALPNYNLRVRICVARSELNVGWLHECECWKIDAHR